MRGIMKILGGLVLLLVLAVGGAAAYWLTLDTGALKGQLVALASKQLGRTLTINGELSPTFSLANGFGLRVTGVTLSNAAGYQPATMLSVNELELVVDIMAALSHKVHVKKFVLRDADVTLEARGSSNNWTFAAPPKDKPAPDAAASGTKPSIAADNITIANLNLAHIQNGVRKDYKITALDIAAAENKPVQVDLTATADGKDIALKLTAGSLAAIEAGQKQNIALQLSFGDMAAALDADYRRAGDEHSFSNLTLDYNGIKATGNIALNLAGTVPMLMADVKVPLLDLAALGKGGNSATSSSAAPAADAPLFSRDPLPWDSLKSANANVALDIKQLAKGAVVYGPANLQAKLQGGTLNAALVMQPPGATKPVTIKTNASAGKNMQLNIDAPGLDAATLAHWLGQEEPLVQAPARFNLALAGGGASLHDVMGGANGSMLLDFAPGKLNTAALPLTLSTVLASVIGADKFNNASVACLKADFGIVNGVATARGLGTDASVLNASGAGVINLRDETVKLRMVVDARSASQLVPLLPVDVSGRLKNPTVSADTSALTGQVVGNVASKLGGIAGALVGGVTGSATAVEKPFNPCRPNDKAETAAAPTAKTPAANPAAVLQDALKDPAAAKEMLNDPSKILNMFGGQ